MMDTRQLTGLLYSMGHTFDNLSSTYLATAEFLATNNPQVIGSRSDLALLEDLRDAAATTLRAPMDEPLDLRFVEKINAGLSRTAALEPGVLRTAQNIMVHTSLGNYVPPVPSRDGLDATIAGIQTADGTLADASHLFAVLAKAQPFGDGNKRTALLAANRLLMLKGCEQALMVPVDDPDRTEFNTLLSEWYVNGNPDVIRWLADYNNNVDGLDRFGHAIPSGN